MVNNEILPMSKSEIKRLDFMIRKLKKIYVEEIENHMMNNGFSSASIINYDNDVVLVEVSYGVSIAIPELCFKKNVGIDRHSMEVIQAKEFYA